MKRAIYLMCWVLCVTSIAATNANAQQVNLSSPKTTIDSFVASLNQYNFKQAALCVEDAKPEAAEVFSDMAQSMKKSKVVITTHIVSLEVNGNDATVKLNTTITMNQKKILENVSELKVLQKLGEWKIPSGDLETILKPDANMNYLRWIATLLVHPEAISQVREQAQGNSCRSNLKQIALGMRMFAQDHNGTFALKAPAFTLSLKPYLMNTGVYICPGDKTPYLQSDGIKTSYSFNANLEDVSQASIKDPSQVVLFYEGKDGKLNFRHNGKACVVFVDGKAQLVSEKEANSLRWKP